MGSDYDEDSGNEMQHHHMANAHHGSKSPNKTRGGRSQMNVTGTGHAGGAGDQKYQSTHEDHDNGMGGGHGGTVDDDSMDDFDSDEDISDEDMMSPTNDPNGDGDDDK